MLQDLMLIIFMVILAGNSGAKREILCLKEHSILLKKYKIALFGAITSKPNEEAKAELNPDLQGKGLVYSSPIVGLRQHFNLDICVRPCKSYKGNPLNFIRRGKGNTIEEPLVDVVIFRQNTECLYSGVEWTNPPENVYQAFMTHPKFAENFGNVPVDELSISTRIFTKKATERILTAAFEHAENMVINQSPFVKSQMLSGKPQD